MSSNYLYNFYYIILISIYITDIIPDKQENESFKDLLEKIQLKAALAITGVIRGTWWTRPIMKLAQSLAHRRWYRKMIFFDKIVKKIFLLNICKATYYHKRWINTQLHPLRKNLLTAWTSRTSFSNKWNKLNKNLANADSLIIIIIIIIIIFVLMSVSYACMSWMVSYGRYSSISVFSYVFTDFSFFQITSDYLIPCSPRLSSWGTTSNLEGSTFTRLSTLFLSFYVTKPL